MEEFLTFRRMTAPALIQVVFWVGVVAVVLYGLKATEDGPVLGVLITAGSALLLRIWCELLILFFRMYETLTSIRIAISERRPEPSDAAQAAR
ncbi:MAG: DUF4282 domain-containing protein [Chloroflexota bacterium]|nr:DUF4282 domain-containing protein [Chloroflexota bacterium]